MSRFIESIKVEDREIFLADLHQKRVNHTFTNFGKDTVLDILSLYETLEHGENGLFKFRIVYDLDGPISAKLIPYAVSEIKTMRLVVNNSINYAYKFEDRREFDKMKAKAKTDEIVIVKNNHITDSSIGNLLFRKGKNWFTPNTCLLNGVQRQHLLKTKKISETEITVENLREFSHFQIINALNEFDDEVIYPVEEIRGLPKEDPEEI